jgi:hypothetical protein
MSWFSKFAVGVGLALVSTAALAFQEERQAVPAPSGSPAPAAQAPAISPADVPGPAVRGTEVTIPGLGKLGVLPKMNFGLELLYGAAESKTQQEEPAEGDGLTIRGSVKHRF